MVVSGRAPGGGKCTLSVRERPHDLRIMSAVIPMQTSWRPIVARFSLLHCLTAVLSLRTTFPVSAGDRVAHSDAAEGFAVCARLRPGAMNSATDRVICN